ncbi:MAG: hypothetical protein ACP5G4_08745 [bacterium]
MKRFLPLLPFLGTTLFAQMAPSEAVPVGPIAVTILAVGAVGYGIYRIAKKK